MIPSNSWFPQSLAERAAWMQQFATEFPNYRAGLGFTAAEAQEVTWDNDTFQALATITVAVEAYRTAVIEYRISLCEGDIGDPLPVFPTEAFVAPVARPAGLYERLDKLRTRILAAPTYTDEIGAALGILGGGGGQTISPGDVMPEIQLVAAATGYMFSIIVSKRYDADQWQVWATPAGQAKWAAIATATGKSADVEYVPADAADNPAPAQLQVRVQLRRSNQDYGIPSLIAQVTVNP